MANHEQTQGIEGTGGERFLTDRQVAERYAVRRSTVWAWAQAGRLPAAVRLSPGCSRWRLSAIEAFEAAAEVSR